MQKLAKVKQIVKQKSVSRGKSISIRQYSDRNSSVPGAIRTLDPLLRRQPLCPTELQGQVVYYSNVARGEGKVKIVISIWFITITMLALYSRLSISQR